jgi:hypothetical protein
MSIDEIKISTGPYTTSASFKSLMNYIRDGYAIDDLTAVLDQQFDTEIDWLTGTFAPLSIETSRIRALIQCYRSGLERRLAQQNVDLARSLSFNSIGPSADASS